MRYNCTHTFTLEADSRAEFDAKLARYSQLLKKASAKLDIGYAHGLVVGQPGAGYESANRRAIADEKEPEMLFDD